MILDTKQKTKPLKNTKFPNELSNIHFIKQIQCVTRPKRQSCQRTVKSKYAIYFNALYKFKLHLEYHA